jgi:hypothetical protein
MLIILYFFINHNLSEAPYSLFIRRKENNTTSLCQMLTILFFYINHKNLFRGASASLDNLG